MLPHKTAAATTLMLQRFDRPLVQDFLVAGPDAGIVARIHRARWRQIWRRSYEARGVDGALLAYATQPLSWSGLYWPSWSGLDFFDAQDEKLGSVRGCLWTLLAASFEVSDAAGTPVATVILDDHAQALVITGARPASATLLGQALRVQQASAGRDSWTLEIDDAAASPGLKPIWPLLLAFFAENFETLTRSDVSR